MGKNDKPTIAEIHDKTRLQFAENENKELQSKIETLNKTIDGQRDRIEELASEKEQLNKRIKALESEKEDLEKQIVKLEQKKIDPAKLQELQNTIRSKDGEINDLRAQKDALEREKDDLSDVRTTEKKVLELLVLGQAKEKEKAKSELENYKSESIALKSSYRRMLFTALIALLVGAGVAFSTAFTIQRWWQWQHVIGALGGAVLVLPVLLMLQLYKDSDAMWNSLSIFYFYFSGLVWLEMALPKALIISYWVAGWIFFSFILFAIKMIGRGYSITEFLPIVLGLLIGLIWLVMSFACGYFSIWLHLTCVLLVAILIYALIIFGASGQPFLIGVYLLLAYVCLFIYSIDVYCYWVFGATAAITIFLFSLALKNKSKKRMVVLSIEFVAAIVGIILTAVLPSG